mmetsp:Transcript_8485/g.18331  ORF Transcript_8485/g.18331 Transcript_8485/m.18331 type:complete len:147 (+) Transcript_8485:192-632(+)
MLGAICHASPQPLSVTLPAGGSPVPRMSLYREFMSTQREDGRPRSVNFASEPAQDFEAASFSVPATAVQSPGTPSGQDKTKRKRDRGGRRRRVADAKARKTEGGAKVVLTRHILAGDKNEKNNRTCLADAVAGLFPIGGFKKNSII